MAPTTHHNARMRFESLPTFPVVQRLDASVETHQHPLLALRSVEVSTSSYLGPNKQQPLESRAYPGIELHMPSNCLL